MKFIVNERCIGCGLCTSLCPEVFSMEYSPVAHAVEGDVPAEVEITALDAQASCPVEAIESKE